MEAKDWVRDTGDGIGAVRWMVSQRCRRGPTGHFRLRSCFTVRLSVDWPSARSNALVAAKVRKSKSQHSTSDRDSSKWECGNPEWVAIRAPGVKGIAFVSHSAPHPSLRLSDPLDAMEARSQAQLQASYLRKPNGRSFLDLRRQNLTARGDGRPRDTIFGRLLSDSFKLRLAFLHCVRRLAHFAWHH
jgi:hypothetical protein